MNAVPKQLLNVAGALLVLVVLAAGILLVAVPLYVQSGSTSAEAVRTAQSNDVSAAQVEALRAHARELPALHSDVAALREQIPAVGRLDDVFDLVGAAAVLAGVEVVSVAAEDPAPWTGRAGADAAAAPQGDETAEADAAELAAASPAPSPSAAAADSPQRQVSFAIVVDTVDPLAAARFLDALGAGPRLVSIVHADVAREEDRFRMTANVLAFIRTE